MTREMPTKDKAGMKGDGRAGADNLRSRIHYDLLNKIRFGEIGPSDRLVDTGIAEELGVSRMPVREALLQLANDGYVVGTSRGFVVPRLTRQDLTDLFEMRRLLEPRAAASAACCMTGADHQELTRALLTAETAASVQDADALSRANVVFRHTWISSLTNRRLAETLNRISDQMHTVRRATLTKPATQKVVTRGMKGLHGAFLHRDAIAAHDRMMAFVVNSEEHFFERFEMDDASAIPTRGKGKKPREHA